MALFNNPLVLGCSCVSWYSFSYAAVWLMSDKLLLYDQEGLVSVSSFNTSILHSCDLKQQFWSTSVSIFFTVSQTTSISWVEWTTVRVCVCVPWCVRWDSRHVTPSLSSGRRNESVDISMSSWPQKYMSTTRFPVLTVTRCVMSHRIYNFNICIMITKSEAYYGDRCVTSHVWQSYEQTCAVWTNRIYSSAYLKLTNSCT